MLVTAASLQTCSASKRGRVCLQKDSGLNCRYIRPLRQAVHDCSVTLASTAVLVTAALLQTYPASFREKDSGLNCSASDSGPNCRHIWPLREAGNDCSEALTSSAVQVNAASLQYHYLQPCSFATCLLREAEHSFSERETFFNNP